jgi:beta-lactamase regulating signal transducer with metallopeptidase domain
MTAALALLAGALAVGWLVPGAVRRADLRCRDPLLLIVVWLVSIVGVLLSAAAGVVLLLTPSHGPSTTLLAAIHRCWSAIQHGSPPRIEELTGLLGVALLLAFAARLVVVFAHSVRRRAHKRREHLAVLRLAARSESRSPGTLWLAHDRPLAFSMAGRPGVVVATEGLVRHLDNTAVEAVLAHERAHLRGRHHLLIAVADALRTAVPFLPLFRQAPPAISELIELSADVAAVRDCGRAAVRSALLMVSSHGAPSTSLAMAQHAVDMRMARLLTGPPPPGKLRRTISCAMAGMTAVALPFLLGAGLLMGVALFSCAAPV